jgi:signal transduction histidine kinase/ActR/RegA family two-component response regulator
VSTGRPRSIRWHLFQVLLVTFIPMGLFAAGLFYLHWQAEKPERERSQIESARLLATAVDNVLDSTVQRLSIFARIWAAAPSSDAAMYRQAQEALAGNPDWSNVLAFRADGAGVFRLDRPFGTPVPSTARPEIWRPALAEGRTVVSDVFISPQRDIKVVSVGVPVVRGGRVTHVLIANLNLLWFDQLLGRQGLPEGGVAAIFDRNWKFVARSFEGEARRGTDPASELIADIKRGGEGVGRYTSLNGTTVFTSWTPSRHGWWVAFATPSAPVDNALWYHLAMFGALWAVVVAAGIAYALRKGRRIAGALVSLEARAEDLAAGRPLSELADSRVQEVDHALAALAKASDTVRRASRAKDEFLAMLGHELRNPLAAISHAAAIVTSRRSTAEQTDFAGGVIERQSQHLKRLIDDLLDVGRVMGGKILPEREPLDLAACARQAAAALEVAGRLAQRSVEIQTEPAWVSGDATRLEQIVTNLLVNAAAYTSSGGRIGLRVAREGADAVLEVSDDGRGIEAESLPRVFELFYQGDATVDRAGGGLGVGLTLVQRLAELHGGRVQAHSAGRDRGATFTLRIPAIDAPAEGPPVAAEAGFAVPREILIVEDNADERESLRVALELQGHSVLEAADGPAALELLRRHAPSVAILDIGLPGGMDGYRLAQLARAELGPDVFLIALTGYGSSADQLRAREAGFDRHLVKPAGEQLLAQAIRAARPPRRSHSVVRA